MFLDFKFGLSAMFVTIAFFHLISRVIKKILPIPLHISQKGNNEVWKWRNLLLSWCHALVATVWNILCFYYYPELLSDMINHITPFTYYLVVFCTGYFIYDFGDMIVHNKVFEMWELTLHHIAVISMFFYNVVTLQCIGYNVVAIMAEISSLFLHSRKILQMMKCPFDSPIYRLTAHLNTLCFIVCRGWSLCRITYGMYIEKDHVDATYYFFLCVSMFIMDLLNPVLLFILIRNDYFNPKQRAKLAAVKSTDCNDNIPESKESSPIGNGRSIVDAANTHSIIWDINRDSLIPHALAYNNCAID